MNQVPQPHAKTSKTSRLWKQLLLSLVIIAVGIYGIYHLTGFVSVSSEAQTLVTQFGYWGVLFVAFLTGLSAISPLPTGVFTPVFTEAGLWLPLIITAMVIGTTLADLLAYYLAFAGRTLALEKYPSLLVYTEKLRQKSRLYIMIGITVWAAVVPFPNELPLIACALIGIRLRRLLIPLLVGTLIFHTIFSVGTLSFFSWL